jgi:hypothetical protein
MPSANACSQADAAEQQYRDDQQRKEDGKGVRASLPALERIDY